MANQSNFIVFQQFLCWTLLSTIYLFVFQLLFVCVLQNSFETKIFFHITLISKIKLYLKRYLNKLFLDLQKSTQIRAIMNEVIEMSVLCWEYF